MSPNDNCLAQHSEPVDRAHQSQRRGVGTSRLRRRERKVAAIADIDIGDTSEETVIVDDTTPVAVEETEPAENAKDNKNSENAIKAANIYITTWAEEANEVTNLEDSAYDIESVI